MSESLPLKKFRWLKEDEFENINWLEIDDNSEIGYILEVDLEYPKSLHAFHSEYPLAPVRRKIQTEELSEYQKSILELMKSKGLNYKPTEKLILDLYDKKNYVLHYKNLKTYLELGLKLKKVHKVLEFNQSKWLEPYIDLNTKLREKAIDKFEQDLFKLMNNSVFGKSCENVRNHINIKIVLSENQAKNYLKKPLFQEFRIIDENKAIIRMRKSKVSLCKPIFVGFSVLELSKKLMYEYHYFVFKKYFKNSINLCYTDTDSLIYELKTQNITKDFSKFEEFFDFSNYDKSHKFYSEKNKKKIGFMKDETAAEIIQEFIGLKSKLYSIQFLNGENIKRAKGLQNIVLKKFIKHDYYRKVLENDEIISSENRRIESKNFELRTVKINKISHTPFDDKRFICSNKIDTLPHGYVE